MSVPLSTELREAGKSLVQELDRKKFIAKAAFWFFVPERGEWRLLIATPTLRIEGPKKIYKRLQAILAKMDSPLSLDSVALLDAKDPLIALLGTAISTGNGISGIQFSGNTINGHFIEDAYIYRIAA